MDSDVQYKRTFSSGERGCVSDSTMCAHVHACINPIFQPSLLDPMDRVGTDTQYEIDGLKLTTANKYHATESWKVEK